MMSTNTTTTTTKPPVPDATSGAQRKAVALAQYTTADEGVVEMIVSVFGNVDSYGERVMPGAFNASLARKLPKGVWSHDWTQPVARTLEGRELLPGDPMLPDHLRANGGLYIKGQFNLDTTRGREAFSDVKFGLIDEFSIGYLVNYAEYNEELDCIDLVSLDLKEWSPVLVGANDQTTVLSVKATPRFGPLTLQQHADAVLATNEAFIDRVQDAEATRTKEGRTLSSATIERLRPHPEMMRETAKRMMAAADDLDAMIQEAMPKPKSVEPLTAEPQTAEPGAAEPEGVQEPAFVDPDIARGVYAELLINHHLL